MIDKNAFRDKFQALSIQQQKEYINSLDKDELEELYRFPEIFLFNKQLIPNTTEWRYCLLRCGRRFGKTTAGSAWVASKIYKGAKSIGLCGPTYDDVAKVMVPNIQSWFPEHLKPIYNNQQHTLTFKNGAIIYCMTSDKEERGKSIEFLWCDELGSWCDNIPHKVKERFQILDTACSVGKNPQTIITTTPKPFPLLIEWQKLINNNDSSYIMINGTMFDNPHLSEKYRQAELAKYGSTRLGRQEIYGDLLIDVEGALWTNKLIEECISPIPKDLYGKDIYYRTVIAVDPAVSTNENSDETGIVVACLSSDGKVYILEDESGVYSPNQWAVKVSQLFKTYAADRVIAEKNMGGDLVETNLRTVNRHLPIKLIHAFKGKMLRAEPVAALYEQNKVKHVKSFVELEKEMTSYTGKEKSPNRLDALCYAVNELMLNQTFGIRSGFQNIGQY